MFECVDACVCVRAYVCICVHVKVCMQSVATRRTVAAVDTLSESDALESTKAHRLFWLRLPGAARDPGWALLAKRSTHQVLTESKSPIAPRARDKFARKNFWFFPRYWIMFLAQQRHTIYLVPLPQQSYFHHAHTQTQERKNKKKSHEKHPQPTHHHLIITYHFLPSWQSAIMLQCFVWLTRTTTTQRTPGKLKQPRNGAHFWSSLIVTLITLVVSLLHLSFNYARRLIVQ